MTVKDLAELLTAMCVVPEVAAQSVIIFDGHANHSVRSVEMICDGALLKTR